MLFITKSENETIRLGKKFSRTLKGGEVILLIGNLGSGKTTFVKGVAQGLGVKKNITSPTFILMKVYRLKKPKNKIKNLVHLDTYRGLTSADFKNIGATEYFGRKDAACFVEWGAKLEKYLKQNSIACVKIKIKILSENKRRFEIKNKKPVARGQQDY
jgi:tRNA threonylcarbamoyladenosine biosynthesis protein TsaE